MTSKETWQPEFVFDENFSERSIRLANAACGWECTLLHHRKRFRMGAEDEDWVPLALEAGMVVITRDNGIRTQAIIADAMKRYPNGTLLFLPGLLFGEATSWNLIKWVFCSWPKVLHELLDKGPGAYWAGTKGGLRKANLMAKRKRKKSQKQLPPPPDRLL